MDKKKSTQVSGLKTEWRAKVYIDINLEQFTLGFGKIICTMVMENINSLKDAHMKGNGLIIKCMVKEYLQKKKEINGKESLCRVYTSLRCRNNSSWRKCLKRNKMKFRKIQKLSSLNLQKLFQGPIKKPSKKICYHFLQPRKK